MIFLSLRLIPRRRQWADYFDSQNVTYAFYSALKAMPAPSNVDERDIRQKTSETYLPENRADNGDADQFEDSDDDARFSDEQESESEEESSAVSLLSDDHDGQDERIKVLTVLELQELFMQAAPDLTGKDPPSH